MREIRRYARQPSSKTAAQSHAELDDLRPSTSSAWRPSDARICRIGGVASATIHICILGTVRSPSECPDRHAYRLVVR